MAEPNALSNLPSERRSFRSSGETDSLRSSVSSITEIMDAKRNLYEAPDRAVFYRNLKHMTVELLSFAVTTKPPFGQTKEWEESDKPKVRKVLNSVLQHRVQVRPVIRLEIHSHNEPVLYDVFVADLPMTTCDRGDRREVVAELVASFIERENSEGIEQMEAAFSYGTEVLSKYGVWTIAKQFRGSTDIFDRDAQERTIEDEREYAGLAKASREREAKEDDDDDDDDSR